MNDNQEDAEILSTKRRDYLRSLSAIGTLPVLSTGQKYVSQQITSQVTEWANQDNMSDIAQWQFSPTPGYDREDSFFVRPYPDNGTVYVGDLGGRMYALSAENGEQDWRYEGANLPIWGQPVTHQNNIYFGTGESEDSGSVYALDRETGEEQWVLGSFNDPIQTPISAANGIVYFAVGQETYAVDSETGERLWSKQIGNAVPVVRENTAYFNSRPPTALDAESGDTVWGPDQTVARNQPLVTEDGVYAGRGYYDIETGEEIFTFDNGRQVSGSHLSCLSDNYVFMREDGAIHVFDAGSGDKVREINVSGIIRSMLCVDQTLYVGTAQTEDGGGEGEEGGILYVINAETGEHLWAASARNAELRVSPRIDNGLVFAAGTTGQLFAVEHDVNPFSDTTSSSPLPPVFQRAGDQADNPLFLGAVGTGILGVGYGTYRKFRSDSEPAPDTGSPNVDPSTDSTQSTSDDPSPVIDSYSEITLGEVVNTTNQVQLQSGVVDQQPVWVITPRETSDETMDTERLSTFSDQVEPWAKMDSTPNLVSVHGVGKSPLPWAAVEQANYPTLMDIVRQVDSNELYESLQQVCETVHHVHRYGTTYRNLTTESVLQTEEGTIKLRGVLDQFKQPDPWYNAPEEFDDKPTERSAVYRIGVITYELLTGTLPYPTYPDGHAKASIQSNELVLPSEQVTTLPEEVDETLMTALSATPADRYETVLHFRDKLRKI